MTAHKREHDLDKVGILIGTYRVVVMTLATGVMGVGAYYWDDMNNAIKKVTDSFHVLAVNFSGLNEKLANVDKQNTITQENQKEILNLVNQNKESINENTREIDRLKIRVDYLRK